MVFNNLGFGTIVPGATQQWSISWSGPADRGAVSIHADPLSPDGSLQVNDQTKHRISGGGFRYLVTIRNVGLVTTNFSLQGGGYA